MDNQHRKISGYRELSQEEIDAMNEIKTLAKTVGELIDKIQPSADPRWLAIGKTELQQGFMALTRSIAKPEFF